MSKNLNNIENKSRNFNIYLTGELENGYKEIFKEIIENVPIYSDLQIFQYIQVKSSHLAFK